MTELSKSSWRTASDSIVSTLVTTDPDPDVDGRVVATVTVTVDADMTLTEARRLRDELDTAIARARNAEDGSR